MSSQSWGSMMASRAYDLTGKTFNRLTAIRIAGRLPNYTVLWECRCECGAIVTVRATRLISGAMKSCGCFRRDYMRAKKLTHGLARTAEHKIWVHMRERCFNPNATSYARYGAKGITVCERWNSFESFLTDMGPRPSPKHSIDRFPNQKGDYEPGNCRWATAKQQMRNVSSNHLLAFRGEEKPLTEWAEILGIPVGVVRNRIRSLWSEEDALTRPVEPRKPRRVCQLS